MATLSDKQSEYLKALSAVCDQAEARAITLWILEEVLHVKGPKLSLERFMVLTTHQEDVLDEYLQRLLKYEPVQYILGYAEFYGLKFKVSPAVLIPRPETEELVELIEEEIDDPNLSIIDIGTGSGCIPITLKKNISQADVTGVDISENALQIARENAQSNGVDVTFIKMDILHEIPSRKYDVIVSNPPYIGYDEKEKMNDNVLIHEPHLALFSEDPLAFYKRIAEIAPAILNPEGKIYLEVSEFRAKEVADIFAKLGHVKIRKDMSGKERIVFVQV
jgi:release factor glutamine methyltransferase